MNLSGNLADLTEKILLRMRGGQTIDVMPESKDNIRNPGDAASYTARFILPDPRHQVADELDYGFNAAAISLSEKNITRGYRLPSLITRVKNAAFPVLLALVVAFVLVFGLTGTFRLFAFPLKTAPGTLSSINGIVAIQSPDSLPRTASIGMELSAGTRIKTAPSSTALVTFLDGSMLKMGPETELEIQQLEFNDKQAVAIVIKQLVGSTWSSVVKMSDTASRYEIITPSATVLVHGTTFSVEVDATGKTTQHTSQGLVSVKAQGQEVFVSPWQSTYVESGSVPAVPREAPPPEEPEKQIARQYGAAQTRRYTPPAFRPGGFSGDDAGSVNAAENIDPANGDDRSGESGDFSGGQRKPDSGLDADKSNSAADDKPERNKDDKGGSSGGSSEDKEKKNADNNGNAGDNNPNLNPGNNQGRNEEDKGNSDKNGGGQGGGNSGQDNSGNPPNNGESSGGDNAGRSDENNGQGGGNNSDNRNQDNADKNGGQGNSDSGDSGKGQDKDKDKDK